MLDIFFALLAAGMNAAATPQGQGDPPAVGSATVQTGAGATVAVGDGVVVGDAPAATTPVAPSASEPGFNMGVVPAGLVADPQTPSGNFTTAAEVKPILNATKGNWVAVRDFDGQDLLYVTHLWAWRCGLKAMAISVNGEPMQNWPLPACHEGTATPNAILEEDGAPYLRLRQGSVTTVTIQIVYDDLSMDAASFARNDVLMP